MEPICTFDQLLDAITSFEPLAVAVVGATDLSVLQGVVEAAELGIIRPTNPSIPSTIDVAISAESARTKGIDSPVSGDVDILLAPDLDAGNILVKDLEYLAAATIAGIVLGASAPIILTSRSDPPRSRLLSCAVASYLARTEPT